MLLYMSMTLKQIKFDDEDIKAVEMIWKTYGCDSFSQAVRLAARMVATNKRIATALPTSPKFSNTKRSISSVAGLIPMPDHLDPDQIDKTLDEVIANARLGTYKTIGVSKQRVTRKAKQA